LCSSCATAPHRLPCRRDKNQQLWGASSEFSQCITVASVVDLRLPPQLVLPLAPMRSMSAVEVMLIAAVGGAVLCATVPAFIRNLRASRMAEPMDGLQKIATRASALAAGRPMVLAYPPSVGMTPSRVPAGTNQVDAEGTWDNPTWRQLDFSFTTAHAFAFEFDSQCANDQSAFVATAHGDLDGDGQLSTFEIRGSIKAGGNPEMGSVDVWREVE